MTEKTFTRTNQGLVVRPEVIGSRTMAIISSPWPADLPTEGNLRTPSICWEFAWATLRSFLEKMALIDSDLHLSPEGRSEQARKAAPKFIAKIDGMLESLLPLETRISTLEASILENAKPSNAVEALRHSEIRGFLLRLDRAGIGSAIVDALDQGDTDLLRAVLDAPRCFGLLDDVFKSDVILALDQDSVEASDQISDALELARGALAGARAEIVGLSGVED